MAPRIPATSAAPERLFPTSGNTMTKKWFSLSCDHLEECVYLHEGWTQVRKWAADKKVHDMRVEFLLKTDSGYPKDTGVNKPWQPLGIPSAITPIGQLHQSPPSPIPGDLGRGPSHQPTCSNIETELVGLHLVFFLTLSLRRGTLL